MLDKITACAPGRVNLIGDHTDYAYGLSLPIATDLDTCATLIIDPSSAQLNVTSDLYEGSVDITKDTSIDKLPLNMNWAKHIVALAESVPNRPFGKLKIKSTLPLGSGLSSSAALQTAVGLVFGANRKGIDLAKFLQTTERLATGVTGGLLDQMAIIFGKKGSAILLNFDDLSYEYITLPENFEIIVVHSGVRRELSSSKYKERFNEFKKLETLVGRLDYSSDDQLKMVKDRVLLKRARHFISESQRVLQAKELLHSGDINSFGTLMVESHKSLKEDFEVSIPALDNLVDSLLTIKGVYGARLTGAGFGGCIVAVCEPGSIELGSLNLRAWKVSASDGAHICTSNKMPNL